MRPIDADVLLEKAWDADTRIGYVQVVDVGDILDAPTVELEQKGGKEMDDLISRQDAIDALGERPMVWTDDDQYALGERNQYDRDRLAIGTLPSAEKVGKWMKAEKGGEWWYACSICSSHIPKTLWGQDWHSSYCPNCGARLIGEEE